MPEGQENDWFDSEELPDGIIWTQQFPGGEIEQEQCVEGQTDGHIVDQGDIQEPRGRPKTISLSTEDPHMTLVQFYSTVYITVLQYQIEGKRK